MNFRYLNNTNDNKVKSNKNILLIKNHSTDKYFIPNGYIKREISTSIPSFRNKSKINKKGTIFDNFEKMLNKKSDEDFNCCYNLNRNLKIENHINNKNNKISNYNFKDKFRNNFKNNIKPLKNLNHNPININIIFQTESIESSEENENFRETFLTKLKNNNHKKDEKLETIDFKNPPNKYNFNDIMKEVHSVQEKINNETEDLRKLIIYAQEAKEKIKLKSSISKIRPNFYPNFKIKSNLNLNSLSANKINKFLKINITNEEKNKKNNIKEILPEIYFK